MTEEVDFNKIPLEDRVVHKVWKARVNGYEECAKHFKAIDDPKSNEYSKYIGLLKKFVIDSNAVAQEKGLDAVLAFVEYASPAISGRAAGDVVSGVVTKCLNARPKTKQKGIDICMMYLEVEKQEAVQEELLKGLENKQPKIVTGCVSLLKMALSEFGGKIFPLKPVVKVLPKLFDHSDKAVREETKLLTIEIYKWIRDAVKSQLSNIKPVQMKELEEEWSKLDATPPKPTRFTRSQQEKKAQATTTEEPTADVEGAEEEDSQLVEIDPYELVTAVDILSKLPKDFYENMAATKWSTRKEALEQLEKLTSNPKLEAGQYGEIMAVLKKAICKDSNVVVVALACKCVTGLANGLRKKFSPYSSSIVSAILEKFKEKKVNVVTSLKDAIDAVFVTTNLAAIQEDVITSIASKNPSVREETVKFLTRAFCKSKPADLPRQTLKPFSASLTKCMDDTSAPVRDAAAEALGTLSKLLGERAMGPYVDQLDKIKLEKVKEFADKAEIKGAPSGGGAKGPPASKGDAKGNSPGDAKGKSTADAKASSSSTTSVNKKVPSGKTAAKKTVKASGSTTSTDTGKSKPAAKKTSGGKKSQKEGSSSYKDDEIMKEAEMSQEEVDAKAEELIPAAIREQLGNANWKERLAGIEALTQLVNGLNPKTLPAQVLIRTLAKKPGWKESNFQVLKNKFSLCAVIATVSSSFSKRSAFYAITGLVDKIGDIKVKEQCKETLMVFAEKISLNYVSLKVSASATEQKNPKVLAESLNWLGGAISAFGLKIDIKPHVNYVKQTLTHTNPAVRTSAIALLGVIYIYTGASLRMFFESEKPALLQQIDTEFEKVKDEKPSSPTRGVTPHSKKGSEGDGGDTGDTGDVEEDRESPVTNLADLIPRIDISAQIKPELISELSDKKWQLRGEALQKVSAILDEAKYITPNIGDLPGALKARFGDSNKNLVITTLNICSSLVKAMGAGSKQHVKTLVPSIIATLGDSKPHVRAAAISSLNSWQEEVGLGTLIESEVISGTLSTDNPNMRAEMFGWLEEKLPKEKKLPSEINLIIPILYSSLEGRSADVRKKAQGALPAFIQRVGWDVMVKQTNKLKPDSKSTVMAVLEKHRAQAPEKSNAPQQKTQDKSQEKRGSNEISAQEKPSNVEKTKEDVKKPRTNNAKPTATKTAPSKKKSTDAEEDSPVLLANPNGRDSRLKAEKELKALKWNFATPLREHIEQLKEQMNGCLSKTLIGNLFHKDFKFQVVALTALTKAITPISDPPMKLEAIHSTDLLLKWCTLRFFDTNTTVLIKCLEFLEAFLTILSNEDVKLTEYEASSFIPYLVQKVGDPKDAVRKMIRSQFRWIIKIYPASKLFNYITEGLKSKNSKTRIECLEELGYLISVYGVNVCQPTPGKALPAVAAQVADRDNGVRNAALNAIVEVYNIVGETVFKYLGRISDKEQSLLDERIRRAGKNKPAVEDVKPAPTVKKASETSVSGEKKSTKPTIQANRSVPAPAVNPGPAVQRHFSLDLDHIEKESSGACSPLSSLVANDSVEDLMNEPLPVLPRTPAGSSFNNIGRKVFSPNSSSAAVDYCVSQIASSDAKLSITALKELEEHFKNKGAAVWLKHLNPCLIASVLQLRMILSTHLLSEDSEEEDIVNLYKCLLNNLLTLFAETTMARTVSRDILKDVIHVLISTLLDENLIKLYEGPQVIRCLNKLMLSVMEKSDRNNILGSLIKLLQESVSHYSSTQKFIELVMKCLWRVTRMLPAIIQDVNVSQALLDLNLFLNAHPTSTWKDRVDDTPLRTIKTVLHSLIRLKGHQILDSLDLIENPDQSEVVSYIHAVLKTSNNKSPRMKNKTSVQDEKSSREIHPQSPKRKTGKLTQELHDTLGEIFRKIGSKENTKQGLIDLYEFQEQHKQVDIDPFLKQTSDFFQKYIARGLKTIQEERKAANSENLDLQSSSGIKDASSNTALNPSKTTGEAFNYRDRLFELQKKYGIDKNKEVGPSINQNTYNTDKPAVIVVSPSAEVKDENLILPEIPKTNNDASGVPERATASSIDLLELRKRLEKIKKNAS